MKTPVVVLLSSLVLPGAHARFTDHQIRVAKPGDPYPN